MDNDMLAVLETANELARSNGHTMNEYQKTNSGMYVARCVDCLLFVNVVTSDFITGACTYLKCTSSVPAYAATASIALDGTVPSDHAARRASIVLDAVHGNGRTICAHCGNGSTIHGTSCRKCSGMNLSERQRQQSARSVKRSTLSVDCVPSVLDQHLIPETLRVYSQSTSAASFYRLATIVQGTEGTRYTAPCGISCAYRVVYMHIPDYAPTNELARRSRAIYAYPCHIRECHERITK